MTTPAARQMHQAVLKNPASQVCVELVNDELRQAALRLGLDPSDDGRTDMFVRTLAGEETNRPLFEDGLLGGGDAPVFAGGGYLVFGAIAVFGLGPGASGVQVVRFDLVTNEYVIASVAEDGSFAQRPDRLFDGSWGSLLRLLSVSADGNLVAFTAETPAFDTTPDRHTDIFVRDIAAGTLTEISAAANDDSYAPDMSADGRLVAFNTSATNLGGNTNVYVFDRDTGPTIRYRPPRGSLQ